MLTIIDMSISYIFVCISIRVLTCVCIHIHQLSLGIPLRQWRGTFFFGLGTKPPSLREFRIHHSYEFYEFSEFTTLMNKSGEL